MSTSSPNLALNLALETASDVMPAWKQELSERLAATRSRRSRHKEAQDTLKDPEQFENKTESRASRLAAKVAERYANAPSYSELLAAEARAAAAVAALSDLSVAQEKRHDRSGAAGPAVRLGEEPAVAGPGTPSMSEGISEEARSLSAPVLLPVREPEMEIDLEDLLRGSLVSPVEPLPANLIEFPRELVAPRKARPRLAEGPLREMADQEAHDQTQLRIFEVASESISKDIKTDAAAAEWAAIRLDADPFSAVQAPAVESLFKAAPLEDRFMAGIVDLALVLVAFAVFILVATACTTHPPAGKAALWVGGLALAGFFFLYQFLFFRFGQGTPGMHYAKIALCTFDDENPSREATLRRIPSLLLAAAPLGLGFAWAWFDPDRLGWHDRLTRMYQRSYSEAAARL